MSASQPASNASLNPRTKHYEFMGPPGASLVIVGVTFVSYALYFVCNERLGTCSPSPSYMVAGLVNSLSDPKFWSSLYDPTAFAMYLGWYAFCVVAWAVLPGDWVTGAQLRNGKYQRYKINAMATCLTALGLAAGWIARFGYQSFTFLYERWVGFITAALLMSFFQGFLWYGLSFQGDKLLALGGNSGNVIYDFFIGRELNPTVLGLDIKSFNELRPGMILWLLIDLSMVCEQATRRGGFQNVTLSMYLVFLFHANYIIDALYNEPAILTTMDIVTDGFGFMLAAGDLLWVPFTYSLQARYLAFHPTELSWLEAATCVALWATGYYIFRTSNNEKNEFRNGRNPKNLQFMETKRGTKLLTSGWWSVSRHPNYFGDLTMALSWCLPTGFNTPVTYFYVIYFLVLLVHRQLRDDEACEQKYGKDWDEYKKLVPYRIFPYVY